jgi:hypothetical protein
MAVAGRRIDAPGAPERFPLHSRDAVRQAFSSRLTASGTRVLVASGACGADLLALDAAGELGLRRRIVLPFDIATFREQSVTDRPGDWGPLFDRIVGEVQAAGDLVLLGLGDGDEAYRQTNLSILSHGETLAGGQFGRVAVIAWEGASRGDGDLTEHFRDQALARGWRIDEVLTRRAGRP